MQNLIKHNLDLDTAIDFSTMFGEDKINIEAAGLLANSDVTFKIVVEDITNNDNYCLIITYDNRYFYFEVEEGIIKKLHEVNLIWDNLSKESSPDNYDYVFEYTNKDENYLIYSYCLNHHIKIEEDVMNIKKDILRKVNCPSEKRDIIRNEYLGFLTTMKADNGDWLITYSDGVNDICYSLDSRCYLTAETV